MHDLAPQDRMQLAKLIVALLDSWGVRAADQVPLLGLPADTKPRAMRRYHENTPLPDEPEVNERVDHLVGIADALRTSNPHNAAAATIWLHRCNSRFDDRTPLAAMIEDGLIGMLAVRTHLDCAYDWDLSGSRPQS